MTKAEEKAAVTKSIEEGDINWGTVGSKATPLADTRCTINVPALDLNTEVMTDSDGQIVLALNELKMQSISEYNEIEVNIDNEKFSLQSVIQPNKLVFPHWQFQGVHTEIKKGTPVILIKNLGEKAVIEANGLKYVIPVGELMKEELK